MTEPDGNEEQELVVEIMHDPVDTSVEESLGLSEEEVVRVVALTLDEVDVTESVEVSVLITNDEGLRELNRNYRGKDETTDVLSFPLVEVPLVNAPEDELWQSADEHQLTGNGASAPLASFAASEEEGGAGEAFDEDDEDIEGDGEGDEDETDLLHLGDIAVSRDAVTRQAAAAGHSPAWELAYLVSHGVLHLVGYDDHTDAGYRAMVAIQEAVLKEAGIPR